MKTPATDIAPVSARMQTITIEAKGIGHGDHAAFDAAYRAALDRQMTLSGRPAEPPGQSLGQVIAGRAATLAGDVKKDQQYVSRLLEQAAISGDSMQMMRAMLALNEYQLRVQTVSKVVAKAGTSVDSLTKLQ